nr:MBL fold metallo-hydrolase [Dethiosulfatibacter aminovorans]
MDIIHVKGNTYCIDTGMTYLPFYKINETDIILLDSGWAKGERDSLDELLDANNFHVSAIINSHSHTDHAGNNAYFKEKYNCIIAMDSFAAHICSSITHLKQYYSGYSLSGVKAHYGNLVFDTDIIIRDEQKSVYINGIKFGIMQTPGHTPGHICITTPDNVAYLGDALITRDVMNGTKLPYAYILSQDLQSKTSLLNLSCKKYIIAHRGITDDIHGLVNENIEFYKGRATKVLNVIARPMTLEDIMRTIVCAWSIHIQSTYKYKVVERMLRFYLEYLLETGAVSLIVENGFLKYVQSTKKNQQ